MTLSRYIRKALPIASVVILNPVTLLVVGVFNRLLGRPVRSVFLCYPAAEKYATAVCFSRLLPFFRAFPAVTGVFRHGRAWGVVMAVSATEEQFSVPLLRKIRQRAGRAAALLGATETAFAGVLPTELHRCGLMPRESVSRTAGTVAEVIVESHGELRSSLGLTNVYTVVLGGRGTIGSQVVRALTERGEHTTSVDRGDQIPAEFRGLPTILINCARSGVLARYLDQLWPGMILLNEVYPEPPPRLLRDLTDRGVSVYHIAGVQAQAIPPFPSAYAGGVPCCAMIRGQALQPIVRALTP